MNIPSRNANEHVDAARAQDRNAETCGNATTRKAFEAAAQTHREAARAFWRIEDPAFSLNTSLSPLMVGTIATLLQFHAAAADAAAHTADARMSIEGKREMLGEAETHRNQAKYWADRVTG